MDSRIRAYNRHSRNLRSVCRVAGSPHEVEPCQEGVDLRSGQRSRKRSAGYDVLGIQFSGMRHGGRFCCGGGAAASGPAVTAPAGRPPAAPPSPSSAISAEYSESKAVCLLVARLGSPRPRQSRAMWPASRELKVDAMREESRDSPPPQSRQIMFALYILCCGHSQRR